MRSKDSLKTTPETRKFRPLLHEILWTVRRYWWVSAGGMLLFFLCTYAESVLQYDDPNTFKLISRDTEALVRIMAVVYGIFAAFCLFRFLWNRRECGMTLSVGVIRWKQFTLRYLFGLLSVTLAVVIPLLAGYYLEMRTMGEDPVGVCAHYTAVITTALWLLTVLSYTIGVLCGVLCGHFLPALLSTAGVLAAPYALLGGAQKLLSTYLFGSPLGATLLSDHGNAGLLTMLTDSVQAKTYMSGMLGEINSPYSEPWLSSYLQGLKEEVALPAERVILLLLLTLGIALLGCYAYCRRPAEHAGKACLHPILTYAVSLTCGFGLSSLVLYIPVPGGGRLFWLTVLLVAAFLAAATLMSLILTRSPRGVLRRFPIPCGGAAVCLALVALLGTGWFGYADYLPETSEVASVRVYYNQNRVLFPSVSGGGFTIGYPHGTHQFLGGFGQGERYYYHFLYAYGMEPRFESLPQMTEAEDIQTVLSIHESILEAGRETYTKKPAEAHGDTVIHAGYRIVYQLKNGKTVERYYRHLSLSTLETTMRVEDTQAFREAFAKTHENSVTPHEIQLGDPLFAKLSSVSLSRDESAELLRAIDADTASQTFAERYFPTGDPARDTFVGILRISALEGVENPDDIKTHPFEQDYETYYLTAAFEQTLAFLRERGLTHYLENPYTVKDVRIRPYIPRFYDDEDCAPSYVFLSCEDTVQALPEPSETAVNAYTFAEGLDASTTPVPADRWDTYIQSSRPVALMTRPGVMVQILLENEDGKERLVTRYLYSDE